MSDRIERKDIVNGALLTGVLIGMVLVAFLGIFMLLKTDKVDDVKNVATTADLADDSDAPPLVVVVNGTDGTKEGIAGDSRDLLDQRGFRVAANSARNNADKLYDTSVVVYDPTGDDVQNVAASAAAELEISTEQVLTFEQQTSEEEEADKPGEQTAVQLREKLNGPQILVILGRDFE